MKLWQWGRPGCRGIGAVLLLALWACTPQTPQQVPPPQAVVANEPLLVCTGTSYSILLAIAEQKGMFAKEGVQVQLLQYAMGRNALEAMLAGKCDVATSADTPIADYGRKRDDLRIIAGIAKSDRLCYIVARKGAGIRQPSDLKGHQVGVTKGSAPHFFLDLLLNKHRLSEKDVQVQNMNGEELQRALRSGTLQVIATTDLNALRLQEELGPEVILIGDPGISLNHGYLSLQETTLQTKQDALRRMLRAVWAAEQLAIAKPDLAADLFATYLKVSPQLAGRIFANITPRLSLEPAMILTLEDNARWLHEWDGGTGLHKSFKGIIRPELLREVAPESVTLQ